MQKIWKEIPETICYRKIIEGIPEGFLLVYGFGNEFLIGSDWHLSFRVKIYEKGKDKKRRKRK